MKKIAWSIFTLLFNVMCFGQVTFEKAYFIKDNGERVDGYIEYTDKSNNPETFLFKSSESSTEEVLDIEEVSEVVIEDRAKYVRATVPVNISSLRVNKLSEDRRPKLVEKKIFLNSLVEGRASLYQYLNEGIRNYYIKTISNNDFELLIYTKFVNAHTTVRENKRYQQQLLDKISGDCINSNSITKLQYQKSPLEKIITAYNNCFKNPEEVSESNKKAGKTFRLNVRPRVNYSSVSISNNEYNAYNVDLDEEVSFGLGLEAEFILPFFQNKWSIVLEPTYNQKYEPGTTRSTFGSQNGPLLMDLEYQSLELPLGIRHYFYLNNISSVFLTGSAVVDISSGEFTYRNYANEVVNADELDSQINFALGAGYRFKKFQIEIKYFTDRDLMRNRFSFDADYKNLSLILGYTLFSN